MIDKKETINIVRVGLILFAITALAALILASVNSFTAPIIAENNKRTQEAAMREVLPEAESFEKVEFEADSSSCVKEIYSAKDAGVAVKAAPNGYGGEISMIVGIDADYKVTGVEIISQSETAGLGANCTKDEFKKQFIGKTDNITVSKSGAKDNQIDAIASATITSKAVTKGVNESIATVRKLRGDE